MLSSCGASSSGSTNCDSRRSADDAKVRASHAANDDKTFDWSNPPATGHPGADYGCRCSAEPVAGSATEPKPYALTDEQIMELTQLHIALTPQGRAVGIALRMLGRMGRIGKIVIGRAIQGNTTISDQNLASISDADFSRWRP